MKESKPLDKDRWLKWIDIIFKAVSVVAMVYLSCVAHTYNKRADDEKNIKELTMVFAPDKIKEKDFLTYVLMKFRCREKKGFEDKNSQKLMAQLISILVLQESNPDIYNSKDHNMFERIKIIDKEINNRQSSEIIFVEMLFQKNGKKTIDGLSNFIRLNPQHWLIPWAYFNIASIYSEVDSPKACEYVSKALNEARRFGYEDGEVEEMARRLKERIKECKGEL